MNMATFPPIDEKASKLMKTVRYVRVSFARVDALTGFSSEVHHARALS